VPARIAAWMSAMVVSVTSNATVRLVAACAAADAAQSERSAEAMARRDVRM
jgi:hypothetical protein